MSNVDDTERKLILELYRQERTHTEIAVCVQRERKIYKKKQTELNDCLRAVEETILTHYRRKIDELSEKEQEYKQYRRKIDELSEKNQEKQSENAN
jgi:hypothetical protein